jgi:glucose/arabinose dehydrogenase
MFKEIFRRLFRLFMIIISANLLTSTLVGTNTAYAQAPLSTQSETRKSSLAPLNPSMVWLQEVASGFTNPIFITNAADGSKRMFIVEQTGFIRILKNGSLLTTPFLDIHTIIKSGGEQGLLALAFHPSYGTNGKFFVAYTAPRNGDTTGSILVLERFSVSKNNPDQADPSSGVVLLTIDHPTYSNHNGGTLEFGGDGYLYWSTGDGGSGGDPSNNAQQLTNLLGKILRIDVNSGSPYGIPNNNPFYSSIDPNIKKEIWAYGLRNPWRFSFDRSTHDLYIGDVGQSTREEVDFQSSTSIGGENYGWRVMEGSICYNPSSGCDQNGKVLPVTEYDHSLGCSIIGGNVYRGVNFPSLVGHYFYGDICSGRLFSLYKDPTLGWISTQLMDTSYSISTFGEDEQGELYLADYSTGKIYNIHYKEATETRFAVIGDYGYAGQPESSTASLVNSLNPDFIITTGDNNYLLGESSTIDANIGQYYRQYIYPYQGSYGTGATMNNFFPSLGNHDWLTTTGGLPKPYLDYFSLPGNERYYEFIRGPVHFFVLDSDPSEPNGITSNSVQGQWLQAALAASTESWNVVYLHHSPYSSGPHGSDTTLQWPYQAWGADIVLSGHDHDYERLLFNDFPYIVNGLGGYPGIYSFNTPIPGSQIRYNSDYGAMLVEATTDYINFKFINRNGSVVDYYSLGTLPPVINAIKRSGISPTAVSNVDFTVNFSKIVTGVDVSDFSLITTGVTGASITNVSGSGSTYTVTVNTGSGAGTIHLDVPVSATITDLANNPLSGLPFTSGESYTMMLFAPMSQWTTDFSYNAQQWRVDKHPRMTGDVNGDGKADLVGFGYDRVLVALSDGTKFLPMSQWTSDFNYNTQQWRVEYHPRMLADVNGDKCDDIVGFGYDRVLVALSNCSNAFAPMSQWTTDFSYNAQQWRVEYHPRMLADVNGDKCADIVGFGYDRVLVALSNCSNGFAPMTQWTTDFSYNAQQWRVQYHPRMLADVNGDKCADIVGFGYDRVLVALSNCSNGFAPMTQWTTDFSYNAQQWRVQYHPRMLADVNGDGKADIVGFGFDQVFVALSNGSGFDPMQAATTDYSYNAQQWRVEYHPRMAADVNGDGKAELIGFGFDRVLVATIR